MNETSPSTSMAMAHVRETEAQTAPPRPPRRAGRWISRTVSIRSGNRPSRRALASCAAAGAPVDSEAGCHGVEVSEQVECEAGEAGQLAGVDCVAPGGEPGVEAVGEDLSEAADVSGGRA